MFEAESFVVSGVQLIALVFGLTEFIKDFFSMDGKKVTALAASLGVIIFVLYRLIGIIPEPYGQVVSIVFTSATFGLSASGYYKFAASRLPKSS